MVGEDGAAAVGWTSVHAETRSDERRGYLAETGVRRRWAGPEGGLAGESGRRAKKTPGADQRADQTSSRMRRVDRRMERQVSERDKCAERRRSRQASKGRRAKEVGGRTGNREGGGGIGSQGGARAIGMSWSSACLFLIVVFFL